MKSKSIEELCSFSTQRLSVSGWKNLITDSQAEIKFTEEVMDILSPKVAEALPEGWQEVSTIDKAKKWIESRAAESHFLVVQSLSHKGPIGFIFLFEMNNQLAHHELRFGYLLAENIWGKGMGTELVSGLLEWCCLQGNIKSISGGVEKKNIGSIRVLEKAGFSVSKTDPTADEVVFYQYQFFD